MNVATVPLKLSFTVGAMAIPLAVNPETSTSEVTSAESPPASLIVTTGLNIPGWSYTCSPSTASAKLLPDIGVASTIPCELVPSPQSMVADSSARLAPEVESVYCTKTPPKG